MKQRGLSEKFKEIQINPVDPDKYNQVNAFSK